ncbi:MAG: chromosomal replication initiator protein DnaA [Thermoanaerobaculaceae bacterium]|jgi:chromosomal replication initiator protein|nr:chromosomal replication initiator protein DnaA [Thermoanaerobaculaceae bacterium]
MQLSPKDLWARVLDEARGELPDHTVRTWLEPAEPIALENGTLVLGAPDQFAVEWNESKHAAVLSQLAQRVAGQPVSVAFRVTDERQKRPQMDLFVAPPPGAIGSVPGGNGGKGANTSTQPLNERYTFETFVIGKSNELAAAAAHAAAESPGKSYNPLFIYGATGLGKTHLMQAIAHAVLRRQPDTRVLYVGAEQFINEVIESIHSRTMPEFRRRYRSDVDLFLVDDVHFLEGKEMTQEEFFHTFNALYEANKQIVLTSDRPPKEIPGLEARLVSRFEWGMVADIGQPDLEHRIAILRKKAEQDHLELAIPDDVLRFIAENVRSNVRELEGCIIKLLLFASLKHKEVSVDLAREALADRIRTPDEAMAANRQLPSISRVQEVVARRWGVTPEGLRSKARIKTLTVPRQIAMFLARDLLQMQLVEIGQAFGGRDHSTVIHSVDKVARLMTRDRGFREKVELARMELSPE